MLHLYRTHHHLSVRRHASQMGVSKDSLSRFERHDTTVTAEVLASMLCWMLQLPASEHRQRQRVKVSRSRD